MDSAGVVPTMETARQVLAAQPFSTLLDAHLVEFPDGRAVLEIPFRCWWSPHRA